MRQAAQLLFGLLLTFGLTFPLEAQQSGRAAEIQESLQSRYRLTRLGPRALGIGGNDNSIRHAGGVVVLRKAGFYGSFKRNQLISMSITGSNVEVLSGSKDAATPLTVGQRFYVVAVSVSSDAVTLGLLSTDSVTAGNETGQLWASLNFFFDKAIIQRGDVSQIYPEIDQWLLPEGAGAAPIASASNPVPPRPSPKVDSAPATANSVVTDLHNGMSHKEVLATMGQPEREIIYGDRKWMRYVDLTAVLENDKLISVENNSRTATIKVTSAPAGADLYVDGALAGSTPSGIRLSAGQHAITVKLSGYQDWQREISVNGGSEINLNATLSK